MQEQKIYGRREGSVGHLVFNNPAKLNAVSLDMWDAFVGLLKDYEKDPDVRCVVVSGAGGKAFVSGADISKFESERANAEAQVRYDAISKQGYEGLYNFTKPTIAKITGYVLQATGSYVPVFLIAASAYLLTLLVVHLIVPRLEPVTLRPAR